jgi:hypothetical protein
LVDPSGRLLSTYTMIEFRGVNIAEFPLLLLYSNIK